MSERFVVPGEFELAKGPQTLFFWRMGRFPEPLQDRRTQTFWQRLKND